MHYLNEARVLSITIVGWIAAVVSLEWTTRLLAPGWFMVILLSLMTLEILSKYWKGPENGQEFNWEDCVKRKFMLISLVLVAFLMDMLMIVGTHWLNNVGLFSGIDMGPWFAGIMLITVGTQIWLIAAEASRIIDTVAHSEGEENIPPVILWVIRQLRKADRMKYAEKHPEEAPRPLVRREYDDLTEDDVRDLLQKMKDRRDLDPPPDPLGKKP